MAKRKPTKKKKVVRKKKAPVRPKLARRKKRATKPKSAPKRRIVRREPSSGPETSSLGSGIMRGAIPRARRGTGEEAAGQSGDLQGLSERENSNSESVEELLEEGQAFEAEVVDAVENTPRGEIRTHERPEDDLLDEGEQ